VAVILPSVMAMASTNEGAPFVAIFALCNMSSAGMTISFQLFRNGLEQAAGIGVFQHPKRLVPPMRFAFGNRAVAVWLSGIGTRSFRRIRTIPRANCRRLGSPRS
jgi:hypothetical protein